MDQTAKKTALRSFPSGLYALGVRQGGAAHAMTANWVMQCSFEPPMLAVAIEPDSRTIELVREAGAFALSVFPSGARQLAGKLGRSSKNTPEKLEGVGHHAAPASGAPVLDEATGWLDCRVVSEHPAGDHILVLAEVVEAGVQREGEVLTLKETGFRYAG